MSYTLSELQEMAIQQQEQIEHNQQLLVSREQRLKYLKHQQTTQENLHLKHYKRRIEQQQIKHLRLKTLENQINQQKTANSTFGLSTKKGHLK
jgi:apoptosis-stimulating of p53 protein 1